MYNSLLRGRIIQKYGSVRNFVEPFGLSYPTLLAKISGSSDLTTSEILKLCDLLDIPSEQIPAYFFADMVEEI